jgi:hypothetical protein
MKNKIALSVIAVLFSLVCFSQGKEKIDFDKFKAEKIAFITARLDLTVEEAQTFWPIYNEFDKKNNELMREEHELHREIKHNETELNDKEIEQKIDRSIAISIEQANLRLEYHNKYKQVLSIQKIGKLYEAENEFRRDLLHRYKKGGPENPPPHR